MLVVYAVDVAGLQPQIDKHASHRFHKYVLVASSTMWSIVLSKAEPFGALCKATVLAEGPTRR
jgi:hypothetical protein